MTVMVAVGAEEV
jgi:hypothetical protein